MAVYLLSAPSVNRVKIGLSNDVNQRFKKTSHWSPIPLETVGVDQHGDMLTEAWLMWKFRALRLHADWYSLTGPLADLASSWSGGLIPGAMYLPTDYVGRYSTLKFVSGATSSQIEYRFGLKPADLFAITRKSTTQQISPSYGISVRHIPCLVEFMMSCGRAVHPWDFLNMPRPIDRSPVGLEMTARELKLQRRRIDWYAGRGMQMPVAAEVAQ